MATNSAETGERNCFSTGVKVVAETDHLFCVGVAYLFGPPIVFYLNYRFKWGILTVGLSHSTSSGLDSALLEIEVVDGHFYFGAKGPAAMVARPC